MPVATWYPETRATGSRTGGDPAANDHADVAEKIVDLEQRHRTELGAGAAVHLAGAGESSVSERRDPEAALEHR